jgi:hypothetical protein
MSKPARRTVPAKQRFARHVNLDGEHHLWTGAKNSNLYGNFRRGPGGDVVSAHRFSYESSMGAIPNGMQVDQVCGIRTCVDPNHLQLVTPAQNTLLARVRCGDVDIYTWEDLLLQGIAIEVSDLQRIRDGDTFPWAWTPDRNASSGNLHQE